MRDHTRHWSLVGDVVHWEVFAGGVGWLEVDPHMAVKIGLVACSILTDGAHKWLFSSVDFDMSVQQSFSHKSFPTTWPCAGVTIRMHFFCVCSHVSLAEKCDSTAKVR